MTEKTMRLFVTAIVERALKDWRKAVDLLADNPDYPYALETKQEIEEFFADEWFEFLCEISPELTTIYLQEMSA
jgi:hypothetical protein